MELVLNNYPKCRNHLTVINELIENSDDIKLAVAFLKASGVDKVIDKFKDKKVKILCSLSFLLTENRALSDLLDEGYELKFCNPEKGIMHTKIWLFKNKKRKKALIGSANFTLSALTNNLEASVLIDVSEDRDVINMVNGYFDYLWQEESFDVDKMLLERLADVEKKQTKLSYDINKLIPQTQSNEKMNYIKDFIKTWINIDVNIKIPGKKQSKLWRGWYIIPDHGLIDDKLMLSLKEILKIISNNNDILDTQNETVMKEIYAITGKSLQDPKKLDPRKLFVRREKNYLLKFGFVYNPIKDNGKPDKDILVLTDYGKEIALLKNTEIDRYKEIYENSMNEYYYYTLNVYPFVLGLLKKLEYIDFFEFSAFVKHIYENDKLDLALNLISMYRGCTQNEKKSLNKYYKDQFTKILEPTASSVSANYNKSIKHQMSAIGWLPNCVYDVDQNILRWVEA